MRILVWLLCLIASTAGAQQAGSALQFDGDDDIASIPYQPALAFASDATATFEMWLQPNSDQSLWHALGTRSGCGSTMNYQIARDTRNLLHFNTSGCIFTAGTVLPANEWSHVAVTADGDTLRFYVNAELVNEISCGFGSDTPAPLVIGGSGDCTPRFPGLIDEVRIWNTARSAEQLASAYNCIVHEPPPDLIGYWKFDEATDSQTVQDSSSSGFPGSLGASTDPGTDDPLRVPSTAPLDCVLFTDGFEGDG